MVDGFPSNPNPAEHDWTFPDGMFREPMDPFDAVILGGHDHEGVPIPIGFQQVRKLTEWSERLAEEGPTDVLVGEINARVTELEARYPGSPIWDRQRGVLALMFLNEGYTGIAMDFMHGMLSPHQMADSVMTLAAHCEESRKNR